MTNNSKKNVVTALRIKHIAEFNPDLSYLTGHCAGPEYEQQDNERIERYNEGHWHMMGIRAEADVKIHSGKSYIISTVRSGGLWSIESDSGEQYINEIEQEELADLKSELKKLGIRFPVGMDIIKSEEYEQ